MIKDTVIIKKEECLSCYYLHSNNETKNSCHEDKDCPANYYEIVIGMPILSIAKKYVDALKSNNVEKLEKLTNKILKAHPTIQEQIMNKVKLDLTSKDD